MRVPVNTLAFSISTKHQNMLATTPPFKLSLNYSPLNLQDIGLGKG